MTAWSRRGGSEKLPAGPRDLAGRVRDVMERLETTSLPRFKETELYGAITIACLISLVLLFRWLAG